MNLLTIDIETRPIVAYAWGIRDQNIGINQIIEPGGILSFAAKFHGKREVHFRSAWDDGELALLRAAHRLLDEADAVMGWNSDRFDVRWLYGQFVKHGMSRPSPFVKVDLMKSARHYLYLPSYKLDFVAQFLGVGQKVKTGGFELWTDVLAGCPKAQALMKRYNIADTKLTEAVFDRLSEKGWVRGLPNYAIEGGHACPHCGSERLQARGYQHSKTRRYKRYQCRDCHGWSQAATSEPGGAKVKAVA
jgi:DNA polymerase elongation subunit (family B)